MTTTMNKGDEQYYDKTGRMTAEDQEMMAHVSLDKYDLIGSSTVSNGDLARSEEQQETWACSVQKSSRFFCVCCIRVIDYQHIVRGLVLKKSFIRVHILLLRIF